jgi:hypothetical protein
MISLEDEGSRKESGMQGRRWVLENCEMTLVARHQLGICQETIKR